MDNGKHFRLCVRAITNQISPKEKKTLDRWLTESWDNQKYYDQLAKAWEQQTSPQLPFKPNINKAWLKFEESLIVEEKRNTLTQIFENLADNLVGIFRPGYRPALVSLAIFLLITFGFILWKGGFFSSDYQTIITQNKQSTELTLSDSTHVRLNSGSSIKFLKALSDTLRQVMLDGEAYFKVSYNKRPFIVITKHARITVLGTQFNVWDRGDKTRVIVKEGRVELNSVLSDSSAVELTTGQMSQVFDHHAPEIPKSVDTKYLLGWLENRLVFEKTTLSEIVAELERFYNVSILLSDTTSANHTITAEFEDASIQDVLSSICLTLNKRWKFESKKYIITN